MSGREMTEYGAPIYGMSRGGEKLQKRIQAGENQLEPGQHRHAVSKQALRARVAAN